MTPDHKTKKAVVVSTIGAGQESGEIIRFGAQSMGHNYSPEARRSFKARHAKTSSEKEVLHTGQTGFCGQEKVAVPSVRRRVKRGYLA